jgi:hypothetical protein
MNNDWPFPTIPSQQEVDCISAYAQAVFELSVTPMFQEGQPHPRIGHKQDDVGGTFRIEFDVPDPFVLRASLPPFRRIWMESEPSHYFGVCNILSKHVFPESRWYLSFMRDQYTRARKSDDRLKHSLHEDTRNVSETLRAEDFVELLLNTRVFHVGKPGVSEKSGKPARGDRNRVEQMLGPSRLEFLCADAFYDIALQSTNLMEMALFFLDELSQCEITSDIVVDKMELPGYQVFPDGTSIRRESPGYSQEPRTNGKKIELLRRQEKYAAINQLFEAIPRHQEELAIAMLSSIDLDACIESLGMEIATHNDQTSDDNIPLSFFGVRVGAPLVMRRGNQLQCDDIEVLSSQYLAFRSEMLTRADWGPQQRLLWKLALRGYGISFPIRRMHTENWAK